MVKMTDLEITRLCAEAIGLVRDARYFDPGALPIYDPLHDDAQAMALVKKFLLTVDFFAKEWTAMSHSPFYVRDASSDNANRAICECVAKMQTASVSKV